jgi:4-hydroxybenzoate polyprenyltransferase
MRTIIKLINNFNELVMFKHSIFALPFIFIAMVVAARGWFGWELFFLGVLAAITARNFAMGYNRYVDMDIDAQNPRTQNRPSVDGRLSQNQIKIFTTLNALGFVLVAYYINELAFYLSFPILFIIGSYSHFKRFSIAAHLILGVSLGLAPIAGVVAVTGTITPWSVFLALGVMFWVAGFDLLYSLQDIEVDKKLGLHSIPVKYGEAKTLKISQVFHVWAVLFWFMFVFVADGGLFAYNGIVLAALMLIYEHIIVNRDFKKIDKAFFTVNGYLGILVLVMIIIDEALTLG